MKVAITGAAGFIGSSLAELMVSKHHEVYGIDCINDYYNESFKQYNILELSKKPGFHFHHHDLTVLKKEEIEDAEIVFHLAGQPGVRNSWGNNFPEYIRDNIEATQVLLECVKHSRSLKRLIFASTSSVYGNENELPLTETARPFPISPYGVTKLAAENLCRAYSLTYSLPIVCLRYFTVYGPRQRPDMAFHRFFRSGLRGEKITVFGDGTQTRDFTFIDDIVRATYDAAFADMADLFTIINVGSGHRILLNRVLEMIGGIMGKKLSVEYALEEKGDMQDTCADISRAGELLSYAPSTELSDGLEAQYRWMCAHKDILFLSGEQSGKAED
ncbi:MAG: NAD-dependent epimerase/dehydratase family protein [Candidatus Latescibacterota bacterium]